MFKRALAHQSNATPIRSSDRRKLVKDVLARYSFLSDEASEEELRELGKLIVPEGVRSAGIETSGGIEGVSSDSWLGSSLQFIIPGCSMGFHLVALVQLICL